MKKENLISRVIILLNSDDPFSSTTKTQDVQRNIQREEKATEKIPEKDLMVDLLDRNFKVTALKMLKELKGDVGKVFFFFLKMYKQSGNISKDIENPKRNSEFL